MASVNKVILIGNLGQDPEIRYTQGGQAVANFSIACNDNWTDKDGQKQERTEWVRITAWGKTAELCGEYLSKGRQVYIEGRMQTREWTDKEGVVKYTTEVVANQVTFLGSKDGGQNAASQQATTGGQRANTGAGYGGGSLPTVFPNYGNAKGEPIAGASESTLDYYAAGARRTLDDPEKERFHDKERALLAAIEAARGGAADEFGPPPTDNGGGYGYGGGGGGGPSDLDIPF